MGSERGVGRRYHHSFTRQSDLTHTTGSLLYDQLDSWGCVGRKAADLDNKWGHFRTRLARSLYQRLGCIRYMHHMSSSSRHFRSTSSSSFVFHSEHLTEELVDTRVAFRVLLEDLGDGHFEIFLSNVLPSFSKRVHSCRSACFCTHVQRYKLTRFGTDTPDFCSGAVTHLLG